MANVNDVKQKPTGSGPPAAADTMDAITATAPALTLAANTTSDERSVAAGNITGPPPTQPPPPTSAPPPDYYSSEKTQETGNQTQPQPNAPVPQHQPSGQGQLVTPLWHLKHEPAWVDCPKCRTQTLTRINREAGSQATLWGVIICLVCGPCCAWIPCVMKSCKDTLHYCSRCDLPLAIAKANGSVEVAQPAVAMQPSQFAYQPPTHELKDAATGQAQSTHAPQPQQQQSLPQQPAPMHTDAV